MLRKVIITLIIIAFMFSMLGIITGTNLDIITARTVQNDIPTFFSFITVLCIIIIILLVLIDFILFLRKK